MKECYQLINQAMLTVSWPNFYFL